MKGGKRINAGRKKKSNLEKKKGVTVYMTLDEYMSVEALAKDTSISSVCSKLVSLGLQTKDTAIEKNIRFIDLFAGMGGMRIGFEQALKSLGYTSTCVFSSEIKSHAVKVYKNYFDENFISGDITKIDASSIPDFDVLLAGFPCQAFSSAGNRLGFADTRGTLFFEIERILKQKKPTAFILENVEGLLTHNNGSTLEIMLTILKSLSYNVSYRLLNGSDFNLAQTRNRIYLVGTLNKLIPLNDFPVKKALFSEIQEHGKKTITSDFTKLLLEKYKNEELYGISIKDKRGGKNNIHSWDLGIKGEVTQIQSEFLGILLKERRKKKWAEIIGIDWMDGMPLTEKQISSFFPHPELSYILQNLTEKGYLSYEYPKKKVNSKRVPDETKEKGYNIVTGKLSFEFTKILDPRDVTPTLVATDVSRIGVIDGNGVRRLTVREGLRLFGFPENYNLDLVSENKAFDLLGNTVCVPVITELTKRLISSLF